MKVLFEESLVSVPEINNSNECNKRSCYRDVQSQQDQLKKHLDLSTEQHQEAKRLQEQAGQQLQLRSQQEANTVEQLRLILREKEAKVQRLEDDVQDMRKMVRSIDSFYKRGQI